MAISVSKALVTAGLLVFTACSQGVAMGTVVQATPVEPAPTTAPLAFEVVSVKPAPPGSFPIVPPFMRDKGASFVGVQRMAAPVYLTVAYAYNMQLSEAKEAFRNEPEWTKTTIYTETFRVAGTPTRDQVREMTRTMLADRFALKVHEFTRDGLLNELVLSKPGVTGPNLKPHPAGATCTTQDSSSVGVAPDASRPRAVNCGFVWYYLPGGVLHVEISDTTIAGLGRALATTGDNDLSAHPIVDATGLTGKFDATLNFRPTSTSLITDQENGSDDPPPLIRALKEQLGIRLESGRGTVRGFVIDHIAEPTPD